MLSDRQTDTLTDVLFTILSHYLVAIYGVEQDYYYSFSAHIWASLTRIGLVRSINDIQAIEHALLICTYRIENEPINITANYE